LSLSRGPADIINPSAVGLYLAESDRTLLKFGARLLARGGKSETVEGNPQFSVV
jgi:uncharacterized protein (DUF1330 family)